MYKISARLLGPARAVIALTLLAACSRDNDAAVDIEEIGQQLGDVMASVDEAGGSAGALAYRDLESRAEPRLFARHGGAAPVEWLVPRAQAALCSLSDTFGNCSSNTRTRNFGGCTIGGATFSGTVSFAWGNGAAACALGADGATVARVPAFTVTGRRGATLTVSRSGANGQVLTRVSAGSFSFTNDGIRRVFANAGGTTLLDFTTSTPSAISITDPDPATRAGRVMNGGTLRVANNLSGTTCDFAPSAVTWTATCNCPTSGSWSGTCSDGKTATMRITGCGSADLVLGSESQGFYLDRCYST